jgi:hypothetical protein
VARDWQQVEARLRARADDFRRRAPSTGAGSDPRRRTPGHVLEAATSFGLLLHEPPVGALDDELEGPHRCADCFTAIQPERLRAAPRAVRCLPCQQAREAAAAHG